MKFTGPKAKRCRRQGMNLYGSDKYDKILQRKPQLPGKGPKDRVGKRSEFARQMIEKQKMRDMYGLSEKQFRRVYQMAAKDASMTTGDAMRQILERRLDNVVYRAGFAMTRMQARQFVSHGLFLVDETRVTCPSFQVKDGMKVAIRTKSKNSPVFGPIIAAHEKYATPGWLRSNSSSLQIEIVSLPAADNAEQGIDVQQVVEFYSRG